MRDLEKTGKQSFPQTAPLIRTIRINRRGPRVGQKSGCRRGGGVPARHSDAKVSLGRREVQSMKVLNIGYLALSSERVFINVPPARGQGRSCGLVDQ